MKFLRNRIQVLAGVCAVIAAAVLSSCEKVPLRANPGEFDLLSAHYFENEKTQYVFYSVAGLRADQAKLSWPARFEFALDTGETPVLSKGTDGFGTVDFSKTTHRHRLVACGEGRICGSFSFQTETPPRAIRIRYHYHEKSPLKLESNIANSLHPANQLASSQSAIVYGVFNGGNSRLQFRVQNNFGNPNSDQIENYGMERSFETTGVKLANVTPIEQLTIQTATKIPFLFPADLCAEDNRGEAPSDEKQRFSGREAWWPQGFARESELNTACFQVRLLDQTGRMLKEQSAIARKNPVLIDETLTVASPLREARKIPLILSYCLDRANSAELTSALFLDYQRYILLGSFKGAIDACFAIGEEERFAAELEGAINAKVMAARAESAGNQDFFFTVIINQNLDRSIKSLHGIVISKLNDKIGEERARISPRLTGAFVYDSQALELRGLEGLLNRTGIVWCPRIDPDKKRDPSETIRLAEDANCRAFKGGTLELGPVNFQIPTGPFPTLKGYEEHYKKFGNNGLSLNPQFGVRAVETKTNSMVGEGEIQYTFFDGERVTKAAGQGIRLCPERDQELELQSLAFKHTNPAPGDTPVLDANVAQHFLLLDREESFDVGLSWEFPFLGGLSYDSPLEGKVFDLIPISKNFGDTQKIGDSKWQRSQWRVGRLMQKCVRFCDHPIFDEAGIYQVRANWRTNLSRCPNPKPVEPAP